MFFKKTYEDRLRSWHDFRKELETASDPIQTAIDTYDTAPTDRMCVDPYTPSAWPTPWEMINENQYCLFSKLLGICYSLQLTERFSHEVFEIHICIDRVNSNHYYLLYIGKTVIGYDNQMQIVKQDIKENLQPTMNHTMPALN